MIEMKAWHFLTLLVIVFTTKFISDKIYYKTHITHDWQIDNDRREWSNGVEQSNMKWPIKKVLNESGLYNTKKLKEQSK